MRVKGFTVMADILLVDDNAVLLAAMVDILHAAGHRTTLAANGKIAIDLAKNKHFDLIITDLIMPEQEGLETIRELRKHFPALRVIAMSGGGTHARNNLFMAQCFGAALTLDKPFSGKALVEGVNRVLQAPANGKTVGESADPAIL